MSHITLTVDSSEWDTDALVDELDLRKNRGENIRVTILDEKATDLLRCALETRDMKKVELLAEAVDLSWKRPTAQKPRRPAKRLFDHVTDTNVRKVLDNRWPSRVNQMDLAMVVDATGEHLRRDLREDSVPAATLEYRLRHHFHAQTASARGDKAGAVRALSDFWSDEAPLPHRVRRAGGPKP